MFINTCLPSTFTLRKPSRASLKKASSRPPQRPPQRLPLGPNLHAAIGDSGGDLTVQATPHLHLSLSETDTPFQWAELGMELSAEAWRHCKNVAFTLTAYGALPETVSEADQEAALFEVTPALRLHQGAGFRDMFTTPVPILPQAHQGGGQFRLGPRDLQGLNRLDLHLFMPPKALDLHVLDLTVTGW